MKKLVHAVEINMPKECQANISDVVIASTDIK